MTDLFVYQRIAPSFVNAALTILNELERSGFRAQRDNVVTEIVPLTVVVSARPRWRDLLDRLYPGDQLVVVTLDSLGRTLKEIRSTVLHLRSLGVRVHCLALDAGRIDLASAAGKVTLDMLVSVDHFQQVTLYEQRQNAAASGRAIGEIRPRGRPLSLTSSQIAAARRLLAEGKSVVHVANCIPTSRQTIMRLKKRDKGAIHL